MIQEELKQQLIGSWRSIAPELRPGSRKTADGNLQPFYLSRTFRYSSGDRFDLRIDSYADPYGEVPVMQIDLSGHMEWVGTHRLTPGAQKVNFTADISYTLTPLAPGFTDILNKVAAEAFEPWNTGTTQSIYKKVFAPFGLNKDQLFKEYDLVYLYEDWLFWGARHIDGRGFDCEANRPTNLQIPMRRE